MTIAIYARQSVDKRNTEDAKKDKDSLSIEIQVDDCKRYLERTASDANIVVFRDLGFSGKSTNRPQLQRLLNEIERERIDKVIVYKLDRISRNIVDFYNLWDFMQKHHCAFSSVNDGFDTNNSMGLLLMGILMNFAQMERENIQQRVKDSYYMRAKSDGRWLGGRAPFGYDKAKTAEGISTLTVNEEQSRIVSVLFQKYAWDTSSSLHQLVAYLHKNYGIEKQATAINNILSNPLYVKADKRLYDYYKSMGCIFLNIPDEWDGTHTCQIINKTDQSGSKKLFNPSSEWNLYITNWAGFIDSRTFIVVQERLRQNVAFSRDNSPKGAFKELSGLVKCPRCGRAVKIKGKYGSMSCTSRSEMRGACDISYSGVRLAQVQERVGVEIQKYLDNFQENQRRWRAKKAEYDSRIKKLETEIDNLVNMIAENPNADKVLLRGIEKRQEQLAELQYKKQTDVSPSDKIEYRVLKALQQINPMYRADLKHLDYNSFDTEQKQALLKIIVKRILLDSDGSVAVEFTTD